jgi:hypothetical protein
MALYEAGGGRGDLRFQAIQAVRKALELRGWRDPVRFNDAPTTTHQDVLDVLEDAAVIAVMGGAG